MSVIGVVLGLTDTDSNFSVIYYGCRRRYRYRAKCIWIRYVIVTGHTVIAWICLSFSAKGFRKLRTCGESIQEWRPIFLRIHVKIVNYLEFAVGQYEVAIRTWVANHTNHQRSLDGLGSERRQSGFWARVVIRKLFSWPVLEIHTTYYFEKRGHLSRPERPFPAHFAQRQPLSTLLATEESCGLVSLCCAEWKEGPRALQKRHHSISWFSGSCGFQRENEPPSLSALQGVPRLYCGLVLLLIWIQRSQMMMRWSVLCRFRAESSGSFTAKCHHHDVWQIRAENVP